MPRLDNAEFLKQVEAILATNGGKSSVYLTQKRLSVDEVAGVTDLSTNVVQYNGEVQPNASTYPVLVRISLNGKVRKDKKDKLKLSTVVETAQLEGFWTDYSQVIKNGFIGLKRKEKKKAKKGKVSK